MLAKELIDRLERLGLLDEEIIAALREQLEQSGVRVTPEAIAKLLVDNGQLTRFQATKMIGDLRSEQYDDEGDNDESGEPALEELALFDEDEQQEDEEDIPEAVAIPVALPTEPIVEESVAAETDLESIAGGTRPTVRRTSTADSSIWDSFKVYGWGGIVIALLLAGGALYFVLSRKDASEVIKQADKLYDQQNYEPAQERYVKFLDAYGADHQFASRSRTRIAMTRLFRARDLPDPTVGIEVARKELPAIGDEPALEDDRQDLATLMVDIADNIAKAADTSESTEEKKSLLGKLDEQTALVENPLYVTSTLRVALGSRLAQISETRARVQREINRNVELDAAVKAMKQSLADKDTRAAYDTRFGLLDDFPELLDDSRLAELIREASGVQQTLVARADGTPEVTDIPVENDSLRAISLTNNTGEKLPGLRDQIVYVRAGGSVLAFAAEDGRLLWRKYVGQSQSHPPVRIDDGLGVLLSNGERKEISRCDGETGELVWRSLLEEPFDAPSVGRNKVYVSGQSGKLYALDSETGSPDWVTQLPQPMEVSPGVDDSTKMLYVTGDHSNLYVINNRDGSCVESFYVGHDRGTIQVPPLPLLEHLFVIENTTTNTAKVHVLKMNKQGTGLVTAQSPFQLTGNVTVPPILQQRRFITLTDLGQVSVFDVEPSAEREKVSIIAQGAPVYKTSTPTQMTADRSQLWVAGTRLSRFELQINTGQVVRDWVKHQGDSFIAQPIAFEDALIHARVLRGATGVRVTASSPKSGERLWQTDVGVAISAIRPVANEAAFHAITSQGVLFKVGRDSIASGSTEGPIEDPGGDGIAMRFADPIPIVVKGEETPGLVLLNGRKASEVLLYIPTRRSELLRKVTVNLPDNAEGGGQPIFAGGGLMVPLDSGRVVLMRADTGGTLGSPFQPISDPNGKVTWSDPIRTGEDADQIVIADSRNKIYRLRVGAQIRELSQADLDTPLLGSTARVGEVMVGAIAGPSSDSVIGFEVQDLATKFQTPLSGRVQWGPSSIAADADACLLQTNDGLLRAFDADGQQRFEVALPPGKIVGQPIDNADRWLIIGAEGWIVAIDPSSGEIIKQVDIGQPISATPLSVGNGRLLVPGREGVIYIVSLE